MVSDLSSMGYIVAGLVLLVQVGCGSGGSANCQVVEKRKIGTNITTGPKVVIVGDDHKIVSLEVSYPLRKMVSAEVLPENLRRHYRNLRLARVKFSPWRYCDNMPVGIMPGYLSKLKRTTIGWKAKEYMWRAPEVFVGEANITKGEASTIAEALGLRHDRMIEVSFQLGGVLPVHYLFGSCVWRNASFELIGERETDGSEVTIVKFGPCREYGAMLTAVSIYGGKPEKRGRDR